MTGEESPNTETAERELIRMRMRGFHSESGGLERASRNPRIVDAILQIQRQTQAITSIQALRELSTTLPPKYAGDIDNIIADVKKNYLRLLCLQIKMHQRLKLAS